MHDSAPLGLTLRAFLSCSSSVSSGIARLSGSQDIDIGELEVCRGEDGSPWMLGRGSFGTVFKALRREVQEVAIKKVGARSGALNAAAARTTLLAGTHCCSLWLTDAVAAAHRSIVAGWMLPGCACCTRRSPSCRRCATPLNCLTTTTLLYRPSHKQSVYCTNIHSWHACTVWAETSGAALSTGQLRPEHCAVLRRLSQRLCAPYPRHGVHGGKTPGVIALGRMCNPAVHHRSGSWLLRPSLFTGAEAGQSQLLCPTDRVAFRRAAT